MNKPRIVIGVLAAALASTALTGAVAQTVARGDDVVVMRRVIASAQRTSSTQVGEWNVGAWSDASKQCGIARITRQVTCTKGEGQCTTAPPASEDEVFGTATDCPFQWRVGGYGALSSTCSPSAVRQRDVECVDRAGALVPADSCEIAYKPDPVETTESFQSCTYDWVTSPWSGSCEQTTPRTRTATCTMLDYAAPANEALCGSSRPELTQPVSAPERCDSQWRSGAWTSWDSTCSNAARRARTVECIDDEGAVIGDAQCSATERPVDIETRRIVDSCPLSGGDGSGGGGGDGDTRNLTYFWKTGEFGALNSSCSPTAARTRAVTCIDSLGLSASTAKCDAAIRPLANETVPVFTGCTAVWASGAWSPWSSTCSADASRDRTVTCMRTDGDRYAEPHQDEDACDASGKPATSGMGAVYTSCTYRWSAGEYVTPQACGATTATRAVTCERVGGNGAVDDALCAAADRPSATKPATDMRGCTYKWSVGEYGDWNSTCSTTASKTRAASCTRTDDGQEVDGDFCAGETPPKLTETSEVTTGCAWDWAATPTTDWTQAGMCAAVKTRSQSITCKRSDGQSAEDDKCAGEKPGNTETQTAAECSYSWNAVYEPEVASCGPGDRTGTITCLRADGQVADEAKCDPAKKPAASLGYANYDNCTFDWVSTPLGNWDSTCANNASRTATVSCQRSDGQPANDGRCDEATKPNDTVSGINTTGCAAAFTNLEFESTSRWGGVSYYDNGRSGRFVKVSQNGAAIQGATINLKASSRYRVEFWAKSEFSSSSVRVYMTNASSAAYNMVNIGLSANWRLYTATLEPRTTSDTVYPLRLHFFDGRNGFWLDGVKFYAIAP